MITDNVTNVLSSTIVIGLLKLLDFVGDKV